MLNSEDADDIISHFLRVVCPNSQFVYNYNKKKLHGGLKICILFTPVENNFLLTHCTMLFCKMLFLITHKNSYIIVPLCNILYLLLILSLRMVKNVAGSLSLSLLWLKCYD